MRRFHVSALAVISALGAGGAAGATVYDLAGDFSFAQNPNGPWSYNEGANAMPFQSNWSGGGQDAYAVVPAPQSGHIPAIFQASFPDQDWQSGDVIVHSWDPFSGGNNSFANITWTAPGNGVIDLSGNTWMARNIGRWNDVSLLLNGNTLDTVTIFDGDAYDRANPYIFQGTLTNLPVSAGDVVMLRVDYNGNGTFGDFAGLNLNVNFAPAPGAAALLGLAGAAAGRRRR